MVAVLTNTATNSGMLTCVLMTKAHSDIIVGELSTIVRLSVSHSITTAIRRMADRNVILNYRSTSWDVFNLLTCETLIERDRIPLKSIRIAAPPSHSVR